MEEILFVPRRASGDDLPARNDSVGQSRFVPSDGFLSLDRGERRSER